jgi:predicted Zn-dependent protease
LTGCATVYNPATEKKELILIDSAQEVQIGRSMSENIIKREHKPLGDAAKQLFVNKVGQRVALVSDRTEVVYHFMVLDDPDFNAFALPGGYVYIYSGLLNKIDEPELASILAHEVGHVAAKHSVKRMQSALGYNLLISIALAGFGSKNPALAEGMANVSGTVYDLLSRGYSREDELFADKLAVRYLRRAGYDPYAVVRALELLNKEKGPGGRVFEVLSTHPRMQERIRKVKEEIEGSQKNL